MLSQAVKAMDHGVGVRSVRRNGRSVADGRYRGPDRRRASAAPHDASRSLALVLALLAAVTLAVALGAAGIDVPGDKATGGDWLAASTAALAAVAGALYAMRWRLVGEAAALWVSAALLVYSALSIAVPGLADSLTAGDMPWWGALLPPAGAAVVMAVFAVAVAIPEVDSRLTPRRVVVGVAAVGVAALLLAWWSEPFRLVLGPSLDRVAASDVAARGQVLVVIVWVALAALVFRRSLRRGGPLSPWLGVVLLGLAEARLTFALSLTEGLSWALASQLFQLFAMGVALVGACKDLQGAFVQQRSQLLESLVELQSADALRRAERASEAERAHDVRGALGGIAAAVLTLERYRDDLNDEERTAIAGSLTSEIERLKRISAPSASGEGPAPMVLADALRPVLRLTAMQGVQLDADVPDDAVVLGHAGQVAGVVQNLLENARRHAPGSPVTVRVRRGGAQLAVVVQDRGPGVPTADRDRIFERGCRGQTAADGTGLGLHVAARLARAQGGDLWVEDRPGGGASFVFTLPVPGEVLTS